MQHASAPEIFDSRRRRAQWERVDRRGAGSRFLLEMLADDIADRLDCTTRNFENCLITGPLARTADAILGSKVKQWTAQPFSDEDNLGVETHSFDLIISAGTLDSVNDLPGALVQIRRALRPDGLFLGAMFGAGTLTALKKAMLLADGARAASHIHPQIELRAAADLLTRAGFTLPVADKTGTDVRYGDWRTLVNDLRDAGAGNCLRGMRPFLGRDYVGRLDNAWSILADPSEKVSERFEILHLSGWAPSPDQPKPARRGSGTVSLAAMLDKSGKI